MWAGVISVSGANKGKYDAYCVNLRLGSVNSASIPFTKEIPGVKFGMRNETAVIPAIWDYVKILQEAGRSKLIGQVLCLDGEVNESN